MNDGRRLSPFQSGLLMISSFPESLLASDASSQRTRRSGSHPYNLDQLHRPHLQGYWENENEILRIGYQIQCQEGMDVGEDEDEKVKLLTLRRH